MWTLTRLLMVVGGLLALACCSSADVIIVSTLDNQTVTMFGDSPARFGPPIPLEGFKGFAVNLSPPDACTLPAPPPPAMHNTLLPWIGIARRYNCSFIDKILNAQRVGYSAVIVYNIGSNSLISMGTDSSTKAREVIIPSLFIGADDGYMLIKHFLYNATGTKYVLELTDDLPFNLENYLVPFAITIGICFIVMLSFMIVKCVRDYRRSRRHRLSSRSLKKLPIHKFKKGDPYECCAICLDDYVDNDKLRILPCEHGKC